MKHLLIILFVCFACQISAQDSTRVLSGLQVQGTVQDSKNGELLPFVAVTLSSDSLKIQTQTDFDGRFAFYNVPPGVYRLKFRFFTHEEHIIENLKVEAGSLELISAFLEPGHFVGCGVIMTINVPIIPIEPDDIRETTVLYPTKVEAHDKILQYRESSHHSYQGVQFSDW